MKSIFRPAILFMNRFRFPMKFGLIFLIVLIPILALGWNMVSSLSKEIASLENKRVGLSYLKIARLPMEHIQQHRGMTAAYLNGAKEFLPRIMDKRKSVDQYLFELTAIDRELGATLNTTNKINRLNTQWKNIKDLSLSQKTGAAIKAHSALIKDILDLMLHVANTSEITLDSNLDTYYMGTAIVAGLPNLVENMGQARAVGSGISAKGEFTPASFTRLSVLTLSHD